jgi:hypothetical protein
MEAFLAHAHKTLQQRPTVSRLLDVVYDFVSAFKPFINSDIHFYSVPHYMVFKLHSGKCIMQYKLRTSTSYLLPRLPQDSAAVLSNVSILVEDDFVFVDGKAELLRYLDVPDIEPSRLSRDAIDAQASLERMNHHFSKLQRETFIELDNKSYAEANIAEVPRQQLSYDDMRRTSSSESGYICWLKDNHVSESGRHSFKIPEVFPIIYGDEKLGGNPVQQARTLKGAQEIFRAKNVVLDAIARQEFGVNDARVFPKGWFGESSIYRHEVEYLTSLGTEAEIIAARAQCARDAPAWGSGFIIPEVEVNEDCIEQQRLAREKYEAQRRISDLFIGALVRKGQMLEEDSNGRVIEQITRPGLTTQVPSEVDWSSQSFQGTIHDFYFEAILKS